MAKIIKYIIALVLLGVVLYTTQFVKPIRTSLNYTHISDNSIINYMNYDEKLTAITGLYTPLYNKISDIEHDQTRAKRISTLVDYLTRVRSPIANEHYAALIIDLSEEQGVDYRIVVALMGTESGWCKKPIYYNCFGYLNRVKYTSFDDAFGHLIPKISQQYLIRYGWNLQGFIKSYGRIDDLSAYNYSRNMYAITNKLYY